MLFSYNWLQTFFKNKLPKPKELAELLTMRSFETVCEKYKNQDWVLDIDVLPDRGYDCFSYFGIAREISGLLGFKMSSNKEKFRLAESRNLKTEKFVSLNIKNKSDCLRYGGRIIFNVKIGESPKWLKEKLEICGLQPINSAVDAVNYTMLETGQPLHVFDFEKIETGKRGPVRQIIVRRAKGGEEITTLDNKKYKLDDDILVIADSKNILAIAGIKGGKKAEVDKSTENIFIESANFNPEIIKRGSLKLGLKTDASLRFEQGIDPHLTEFALNRAACLIAQISGGRTAKGIVDLFPKKVLPKRIKLDIDYVKSLLGVEISKKEIVNILKKLNFNILNSYSRTLIVEAPTYRLDVSIPENLIKEIGRFYGYENIKPVFPSISLASVMDNQDIVWREKIKDILKEAGFTEVYNYSFLGERDKEIFNLGRELVEVVNPISSFFKYLRPCLIPSLLKNVQSNQKYLSAKTFGASRLKTSFDEIKIFELNKVFKKGSKGKISEEEFLAALVLKEKENAKENGLLELKGAVDFLLEKMGISDFYYSEYNPDSKKQLFNLCRSQNRAEIKIGGEEAGFLGEVSPLISSKLKIKKRAFVFYINLLKLIESAIEEHEYLPISPYPSTIRDISILVPPGIKVADVLNKIHLAGKELIRDVDLFDIYEGSEIKEEKKNFSFHIIYQAQDRTLTSEEVEKTHQKIIKALEENPEWEVRK